jgi:D-aminoacyl-tRNA deacylase
VVTLIIVADDDIASTIQAEVLLERGGWESSPRVSDCPVWSNGAARLWWRPARALWDDSLDVEWRTNTGEEPQELIFLSRHVAASGRPSLTLHSIGVPAESPLGEQAQYGGLKGRCVPPNPRIAALFRLLEQTAAEHQLIDEFDITLEATHHGPWAETPSLFVEIGSTESEWGRRDAAEAWGDVLTVGLGLDGGAGIGAWDLLTEQQRAEQKVLVGLGGGHYTPRHTDVVRKTDCWLGHLLAGYALPMDAFDTSSEEAGSLPTGSWQHAISEAVVSTQIAFPGAQLMLHLDRKSFKGWQRQALLRYCDSMGLLVGRTLDFV